MYKNLRIIFTILSAICLAAAIPLGIFFDYAGWIGALIGAGIFFVLMLLCKQSQESAEKAAETAQKKAEKAETAKMTTAKWKLLRRRNCQGLRSRNRPNTEKRNKLIKKFALGAFNLHIRRYFHKNIKINLLTKHKFSYII